MVLLGGAATGFGQGPDLSTPVNYARAVQSQLKDVVLRAAEKMLPEEYSFRPVKEVRSFAELIGHIADAQTLFCSIALGQAPSGARAEMTKTTKAELSEALKAAFARCDRAYGELTDANAADVLKAPTGGGRARLGVLSFNTAHGYEHYGNVVTYLRLKGIVPPSSER